MKIVSLLPSATEIICEIGLAKNLVGVTHECDYPEWVSGLPKVTRTLIPHDASSSLIDELVRDRLQHQRALYSLDLPVLERLAPDLIVTQALCDVCAVAESEVAEAACNLPGHPKVINLEPTSFEDVLKTCLAVGRAAGRLEAAESAVNRLRERVEEIADRNRHVDRPRVVLLEWLDPLFSSGHWSPELIGLAGGNEVIGRPRERSRRIHWDDLRAAMPEVILIACCGFSAKRTLEDVPKLWELPGWGELPAVRNKRVYVTDGNAYFSRPGPRLVDSLAIAAHAIHPELNRLPDELLPAIQIVDR